MRRHPLDGHLMRPLDDDDDNFETVIDHKGKPCRILRDRGTARVRMHMRDSLTPGGAGPGKRFGWAAIMADARRIRDAACDAALPEPMQPISMADAQQIREAAWRQYKLDGENAWKTPAADKSTGDAAPHVPVKPFSFADAQKMRDEAYRQSVIDLENAWRTP